MSERVLRVPLWIRLWHGITALLFLVLTVTGLVLHFAAPGFTPINYAAATTLHDVSGILLAVSYGAHLVFLLATGYWRQYMPARRGLWRRVKSQVIFYSIDMGRDAPGPAVPPGETRFNALQQLAYLIVVFALLPLLIVTGLIYLYYPAFVPDSLLGLDGLWPVALAHYALGILGTTYLIIHVYMATVGPNTCTSFRLMTTGRAEPAQKR
ncbi:MAG: cytochrome b/b6 domain-containing protein [Gammaproteobacteria bacterium]